MRRLIGLFFVFALLGVGLALIFREHNGYVLIAFGPWRLETSLFFFVLVLLGAFWLAVTLWRLAVAGILLPRTLQAWRARRLARKARESLDQGLLYLYQGRWADAEAELLRMAANNESPQLNYLSAARAAQQQKAPERRDGYLEKAAAQRQASELAVLLTQAELQIAQGQDPEALASLSRLREIDDGHPYVLALLVDLCQRLQDWPQLRELLPIALKTGVIDELRWRTLSARAWADALERVEQDAEKLQATWKQVPKRVRSEPEAVRTYVRCLMTARADDLAAGQIRERLKGGWDSELVLLFGELNTSDRTGQLAAVEGWLKQHGDEPELLLVAGRLCLRNQLWGRARSYFESALKGHSRPDALWELGRLLEEIDQDTDACRAYRQGLSLVVARESR